MVDKEVRTDNFPEWAKGKIMYHIFVDRFSRDKYRPLVEMPNRTIHKSWNERPVIGPNEKGIWNADFYGGNLEGIKNELNYIRSLGVSIIFLSPIVKSQSNHRYDTGDYENVDPYVGYNRDLKALCDKAHSKNMYVILDAVFNHTGNDSIYYNQFGNYSGVGAYQSEDSPYNEFYRTHYENGERKFSYWWDFKNLPVCDGYNEKWINYITGPGGVIDKWFSYGIDGLRLDVADELNDPFIEKIREACHRNKEDSFILGEVWDNPMRMGRNYLGKQGMDSVMNYHFVDALIRYFKYADTHKLGYVIDDILREYPEDTVKALMNFTSTHDISRAIDIFGADVFSPYTRYAWDMDNGNHELIKNFHMTKEQYKHARDVLKAYSYTLCLMPGIYSIFYGDEVGVEGLGNLDNRKPMPWNAIDKNLLKHFRMIGHIRRDEPFLEDASLNMYDINDNFLMFEREKDNEKALTIVSRLDYDRDLPVPEEYQKPDKIYTLKKHKPGILESYGGITLKKNE